MELKVQIFERKIFLVGLLILMLALIMFLLGKQNSLSNSAVLDNVIENSQRCKIVDSYSKETFSLFVHSKSMAVSLMDLYCNSPNIAKQFGEVVAYWGGGDRNTLKLVGNGIANLALVKENLMGAIKATQTHGYEALAEYPDYKVFLIAQNEKPELSKEYLWDKRIGLIDYPTSRSGHIVPKQLLIELGMSLERMNIVYANSHQKLRELLLTGEVDLISSYWQIEDEQRFSKEYKVEVDNDVLGSAWYLKMNKNNTSLYCESQRILDLFTANQQSKYYSKLKLENPEACYE